MTAKVSKSIQKRVEVGWKPITRQEESKKINLRLYLAEWFSVSSLLSHAYEVSYSSYTSSPLFSSSSSHVIPNNSRLLYFLFTPSPRLASTNISPTFSWLLRHYVFSQLVRLNVFCLVFPAMSVTPKLSLRYSFQVLSNLFTRHILLGILVSTTCTVFFSYFVFNALIYAPSLADSKRSLTKLLYRLDLFIFLLPSMHCGRPPLIGRYSETKKIDQPYSRNVKQRVVRTTKGSVIEPRIFSASHVVQAKRRSVNTPVI